MGYIKHNALIFVAGDKKTAAKVKRKAKAILSSNASPTTQGLDLISSIQVGVNGYASFMISPDGSKKGWETAQAFEIKRAELVKWVKDNSLCDYIEVQFGGDDERVTVVAERNQDFYFKTTTTCNTQPAHKRVQ